MHFRVGQTLTSLGVLVMHYLQQILDIFEIKYAKMPSDEPIPMEVVPSATLTKRVIHPRSTSDSSESSSSDSEDTWEKKVEHVEEMLNKLMKQTENFAKRFCKKKQKFSSDVKEDIDVQSLTLSALSPHKRRKTSKTMRKAKHAPPINKRPPNLAPVISEEEANDAKDNSDMDIVGGAATRLNPNSSSSNDSDSSSSSAIEIDPAPISTTSMATPPIYQTLVPTQVPTVPFEPFPTSPNTPAKLTAAAGLQARTPQVPIPPQDPVPSPLLSKPREHPPDTDHSNPDGTNKVPELTAKPGLPNYTVGNRTPTLKSSVNNGEEKMKQKPSPVPLSSTPNTKKLAKSKVKNYMAWASLAESAKRQSTENTTKTIAIFHQFKIKELRRRQKEEAKENVAPMEKQRERQEEEALENQQQRIEVIPTRRDAIAPLIPAVAAAIPDFLLPVPSLVLSEEREELRRREREKRRSSVRASHIDMNRQSDIMAAFEESL